MERHKVKDAISTRLCGVSDKRFACRDGPATRIFESNGELQRFGGSLRPTSVKSGSAPTENLRITKVCAPHFFSI